MTDDDADNEVIASMADELAEKDEPMEIALRPLSALHLVGLVQLALRHPRTDGHHRAIGEQFVQAAREYFADCPAVLDVIRRGDDPREDR